MKTACLAGGLLTIAIALSSFGAGSGFETDTIATTAGQLTVTCIGHASLIFGFNKTVIHVDPFGKLADYSRLPKADLILVTHEHPDHCDTPAINLIRKKTTVFVISGSCSGMIPDGMVMKNGDSKTIAGIHIEAVPAYNLVHKRDNGQPFHPKGTGNGYVVSFDGKLVYIAGDTENIPEMRDLKNIDVAFLPMNLPYTMTPEMTADAARSFKPHILYPYHYGKSDCSKLVELLKAEKEITVRIRKMM